MKTKLTLFVAVLALCFQHELTGADLKKGLVAYYPLNGNTMDASANKNHLSVSGSITFVEDKEMGKCISFSGKKEALFGGLPSTIKGSIPYTVCIWIKPKGLDFGTYYFGDPYGTGGQSTFLSLGKNCTIDVGLATTSFTFNKETDKWQLVCLSWTGKGYTIFHIGSASKLEAKQVGNLPRSNINLTPRGASHVTDVFKANYNGLCIGLSGHLGRAYPMVGEMCKFRIYNRALSAEEVKALYDLEKPKAK